MQTVAISARQIAPITPDQVAEVATAELEACLTLLDNLDDSDWAAPTDCAGWTVPRADRPPGRPIPRAGQARRVPAPASPGAPPLSGPVTPGRRNRQQIDDLGGHTGPELAAMLAAIGPKAIRARRRVPELVRRQRIGRMYPEEPLPDDRLSYVLDVLGLRDPWMHRVDLARATGRPLLLGAHDRVITAQVIADLAQAWHGPPVLLELTGPAGGHWTLGNEPPAATVQADAVDYLRALSGRNDHPDLQATGDPTAAAAATAARAVF